MTDADLIAQLRTALAYHETQAERYRKMLSIAEDDGPVRKAPKAKRSGEQRRPPSGGKRSKTRERVAAWLKEHPNGTAAECGAALGMKANSASYHLVALRGPRR